MPIPITGKFQPSAGPGTFDLYQPDDIEAGNINVILQLIAGGAIKGGSHATTPVGEVVVQTKTTTGAPTHSASAGTLCWNTVDNKLYVNNNGATGWAEISTALNSLYHYSNVPDAAQGVTITAGDQQGAVHHSGPADETAVKLYVDAETAPGASGLPVTWQYADTDDLDTVNPAAWTTIATLTLSSEKSANTSSMTNATIPANRLLRVNWGTIVGTPKDATTTLRVKRPLST